MVTQDLKFSRVRGILLNSKSYRTRKQMGTCSPKQQNRKLNTLTRKNTLTFLSFKFHIKALRDNICECWYFPQKSTILPRKQAQDHQSGQNSKQRRYKLNANYTECRTCLIASISCWQMWLSWPSIMPCLCKVVCSLRASYLILTYNWTWDERNRSTSTWRRSSFEGFFLLLSRSLGEVCCKMRNVSFPNGAMWQ